MKKITREIVVVILILLIFSLSIISMNNENKNTVLTSASITNNEKIEWGIKRNNNHEQPDCRNKK